MQELLQAAISPLNIVYTSLLIVVLLYWFSVILGALHLDSFDFHFDTDVDIDVDADLDTDVDAHGAGWFAGALHFFNFGRLPFMVIFTFVILSMWSLSLLGNFYIGNGSWVFALMMFIPMLFVSLIIAKILTAPLVPIFENLDKGAEPVDYIGLTCKLLLPATAEQMGQAEVIFEESPLLINVKVGGENPKPILKGDKALVIAKSPDEKYFLIEKL